MFAHALTEVLYLFTVGDKKSPKADVKTCHGFVDQLRKEDDNTHDPEAAIQ